MPEVMVIGAGPVGLLLSAELKRQGVDVELVESREQAGPGSRAIGIHPPTLAALERSGLTEQLLRLAVRVGRGEARSGGRTLGAVRFDQLSARFPFVATLPQRDTEDVLSTAAPSPQRGVTVSGLAPAEHEVEVQTSAGVRGAPLVVLAGGYRSRELVYRDPSAHIYPDRYLMVDSAAEEEATEPTAVIHLDAEGVLESFPLPGGCRRFVAWDHPEAPQEPHSQQLRMERALDRRGLRFTGTTTGFGVRRFVAPSLRSGRMFVIGDAAHEVSPIGGQGMNLGLLDAASLAPLLATWVRSGRPPELELHRWEQARLRSARRAAGLAGLNTRLGRPAPSALSGIRSDIVKLMLGPGAGKLLARAYAMGFDLHS